MSMDFRQRLEQSRNTRDKESATETEDTEKSEYFAVSRSGSVTCIDVRLADGRRHALPYSYIHSLHFDPEKGITFSTGREQVTITGRNLMQLYENLLQYRVRYVQENQGGDMEEEGIFIEEILVEKETN